MGRPVGFLDSWKPQRKTVELIKHAQGVLDEYARFGPMTLRQIFYRLVATIAYEKTERAYERLGEALKMARRARLIEFDAIRDDGTSEINGKGWKSLTGFMEKLQDEVRTFNLHPDLDQPWRIIIAVEAQGMTEMVWQIAGRFGVTVQSSSGFDGITLKHGLAENIIDTYEDDDRRTAILHIGDHDPSGIHVFENLKADVCAFIDDLGEDSDNIVVFRRIAVTPEQIIALGLETAPAKSTDRRSFDGVGGDGRSTVQAESLAPDVLASIITDAIKEFFDQDIADDVAQRERRDHGRLNDWWNDRPAFEDEQDE